MIATASIEASVPSIVRRKAAASQTETSITKRRVPHDRGRLSLDQCPGSLSSGGIGRFGGIFHEVRAVIGEHGVRHRRDQGREKVGGNPPGRAFVQLGKSELAGAVDGGKQIELALPGSHLGDVDMKIADGGKKGGDRGQS